MTDFLTLTEEERPLAFAATAYVQSRFYPPLPPQYGALAVIALREFRDHGPHAHVNLPDDLNPLPRTADRDDDGDLYVEAVDLIVSLRIEHMLDDDEDDGS